jgi:hypothetical protein
MEQEFEFSICLQSKIFIFVIFSVEMTSTSYGAENLNFQFLVCDSDV